MTTVGVVLATLLASALTACADPGRDALDRVVGGADELIAIAERHAAGELEGARLEAVLRAWDEQEGSEIEALAKDAARALGSTSRGLLAERWRSASERLSKRLSAVHADYEPTR